MAVEQETATFFCQHPTSDGINWRVNGQSLSVLNSPNIRSSSNNPQSNGGKLYSLSIGALSEFNQSSVVCVAIFLDGTSSQYTPPVTLLVQGQLNITVILLRDIHACMQYQAHVLLIQRINVMLTLYTIMCYVYCVQISLPFVFNRNSRPGYKCFYYTNFFLYYAHSMGCATLS